MKIKFGAIVTDGRGKLGGHVFSKNGSGSYIRTKVTPTNPQTTRQSVVRSLFGSISQQWSQLTEARRKGWENAVQEWQRTDIFGDMKKPTGKALFQRLNNQAQVVGYPAVLDAPKKKEMVEDVVKEAILSDNLPGELSLPGASTNPDLKVVVYATASLSAGTRFVKNKLRQIYAADGDSYNANEAFTAYVEKFGTFSEDANIYIGVKYVLENGQASPMQTLKAVINPSS